MASEAKCNFLEVLYAERPSVTPLTREELEAMSDEDASLEINILLRDVESAPATDEQKTRMGELVSELGPRRDGREWELPTETGRAAAFIVKAEGWVKGKRYAERINAHRAEMQARGASFRSETPVAAVQADDEIPF